jgi:FdhD protein
MEGSGNTAVPWKIYQYDGASLTEQEDEVAAEFPLTIKLDGEEFATLVCSPADLTDMVVGFLASEGILRYADQIESLSIDEQRGYAYVTMKHKHELNREMVSKRIIGSCCGKSRQFYFHNDAQTAKTIVSRAPFGISQCFHLMSLLQQDSDSFRRTGGVHNAALCTPESILEMRSDIGRHNALDKIYGHCLRHQVSMKGKAIAFSGRVSSEVVLKVAKMGIGVLLSRSAPTDLALRLAEDLGITVVGFIRGNGLNVYTHPERIVES